MIILNGQQTKFDHKYTSKASASGELIKAIYLLVSAKQDNNINLKDKLGNQNKKSPDISKIVQVTVFVKELENTKTCNVYNFQICLTYYNFVIFYFLNFFQ